MHIVIEIPNKDIPKHQEVIDIRLHFIDEHIVDADGYGFMELPKGHGRLIDIDALDKDFSKCTCKSDCSFLICPVYNQKTIIEADKAESEG